MTVQAYVTPRNAGALGVTTDGAALASSTTLTEISAVADLVLGANELLVGSVLRVTAAGRYSTTGTPTLLLGLYYGGVAGVALAASAAITTPSGVTNLTWRLEALITVRSIGSSGTAMAIGEVKGISSATGVNLLPASAPAVATIDTTAAKALVLGAQWGANSASDTITCHQFLVESVI